MRPVFIDFLVQADKKEIKVAKLNNPLFILKLCVFKNRNDNYLVTKNLDRFHRNSIVSQLKLLLI